MRGKIATVGAALLLGIFRQFLGYLFGLRIVLVGGLKDGLLTPCLIEQPLVVSFLTGFLQLFGNGVERVSFVGADVVQHICLEPQEFIIRYGLQVCTAKQTGKKR